MDDSSPLFMTCERLRDEFTKCIDEPNKRVLIIDVRHSQLYTRSHLCLDSRTNISAIKTKMRVMNIDPDLLPVSTCRKIMTILDPEDLKVFNRRNDATEVILIDTNTDDMEHIMNPKSKIMRIFKGLTKYDLADEKICVPVHVLKGGYREWLTKYPMFTTNPKFDTESTVIQVNNDIKYDKTNTNSNNIDHNNHGSYNNNNNSIDRLENIEPEYPLNTSKIVPSQIITPLRPLLPSNIPSIHIQPNLPASSAAMHIPSKPMPIPPSTRILPQGPKPSMAKNAPGTAVPVAPIMSLRSPLPRSHSSPNVAQSDGDSFETINGVLDLDNELDNLALARKNILEPRVATNINNNHLMPTRPFASTFNKPRFDRSLKPSVCNDAINAIRAQLNFGRTPEASSKSITGLQNLGNTCFMNSVMQCLAYTPRIVNYFATDTFYNHINFNSQYGTKGELAIEFGALIERLTAHKHRYIEPKSFRESVVKHVGFVGNEQQDSHEFMMMLFDKLHHDLNVNAKLNNGKQNGTAASQSMSNNGDSNIDTPRATLGYQFWRRHLEMNNSIISDLFEGIFMSTLTCNFCSAQSNTFELFNCLSLPIPSDSRCHVKECLSHFSNPERIEAAWECPRCKQKREAEKKIVICKLPRILIIHLKRFSLDGRWRQKLQTTVDFPLCDLSVDYTSVLPQSAYSSNGSIKGTYNLCAVVNHYGHLDGGHYTAFCKLDNHRWYTFDDSNVSEMKDSDVCSQAAYILFYSATG